MNMPTLAELIAKQAQERIRRIQRAASRRDGFAARRDNTGAPPMTTETAPTRPELIPETYTVGPVPVANFVYFPADYDGADAHRLMMKIERRGPCAWAIVGLFSSCISKSARGFRDEPIPSSRDDEFMDDTRFESPEKAHAFWCEIREEMAASYDWFFEMRRTETGWERVQVRELPREGES